MLSGFGRVSVFKSLKLQAVSQLVMLILSAYGASTQRLKEDLHPIWWYAEQVLPDYTQTAHNMIRVATRRYRSNIITIKK